MKKKDFLLLIKDYDEIDERKMIELVRKSDKILLLHNKYHSLIKYRKDNRGVYLYLNRKQICASSEFSLYEKLYRKLYDWSDYSLKDLFPEWMKWKRDNTNVSSRTLKIYIENWNRYYKHEDFIKKPIRELNTKDFIKIFRKWTINRDITIKKFNSLKSIINGIYTYAIENNIVRYNPSKEIDRHQFKFKVVNNDDDVFSISDREKILKHLKNFDNIYSYAIQFDFHVTLRIGELLALKWENIKEDKIFVDSQRILTTRMKDDLTFDKNHYETVGHLKGYTEQGFRWIPITPDAMEILNKVRKINPNGKYIFMFNNKQLYTNTFNEYLERRCKEIGIVPRTSHKIRFTVASILFLNNMSLTDLQRLLGHTSINMTMHYIRKITSLESASNKMKETLDNNSHNFP